MRDSKKTVRTDDRCLDVIEWMQTATPTLDELSEYLGVGAPTARDWLRDLRATARKLGYRIGRPTFSNGWRYEVQEDWVAHNNPVASATMSTLTALRDGMTRLDTQIRDLIALQARADGRTVVGKGARKAHVYLSAGWNALEDVETIVADLTGIQVPEHEPEPEPVEDRSDSR